MRMSNSIGVLTMGLLVLPFTTGSTQPTPVSVDLSSIANVYGIVNDGSAVPDGGLDTKGYAYSANLLDSWAGSTFQLVAAAGVPDAVSSKTIALTGNEVRNSASLQLLGTGVKGNQVNQQFTVTYTDGSREVFTQSLSDWHYPQIYAGQSEAFYSSYRVTETGAKQTGGFWLYGYSFPLDSSKKVASVKLPQNRNVVVLAVTLDSTELVTVTLTPTSLIFICHEGGLNAGCTPPQVATLRNTGTRPLDLQGITITRPFSQTNSCPAVLQPGRLCQITISYPFTMGRDRCCELKSGGTLVVHDTASGSPQTVALTGYSSFLP